VYSQDTNKKFTKTDRKESNKQVTTTSKDQKACKSYQQMMTLMAKMMTFVWCIITLIFSKLSSCGLQQENCQPYMKLKQYSKSSQQNRAIHEAN